MLYCGLNLIGIIGLPYSFRKAGLIPGIVILIGLTFVVDWTIRWEGKMCQRTLLMRFKIDCAECEIEWEGLVSGNRFVLLREDGIGGWLALCYCC